MSLGGGWTIVHSLKLLIDDYGGTKCSVAEIVVRRTAAGPVGFSRCVEWSRELEFFP
jgi:hypothetical protein